MSVGVKEVDAVDAAVIDGAGDLDAALLEFVIGGLVILQRAAEFQRQVIEIVVAQWGALLPYSSAR